MAERQGRGLRQRPVHDPPAPSALLICGKPDPSREPSVLIYQTLSAARCSTSWSGVARRTARDDFLREKRTSTRCRRRRRRLRPRRGLRRREQCDARCHRRRGAQASTSSVSSCRAPQRVVRLSSMPEPLSEDAVHLVPGKGAMPRSSSRRKTDGRPAELAPRRRRGPWNYHGRRRGALCSPTRSRSSAAFNTTTAVGEQFDRQNSSRAATIRCNAYTYGSGFIGDAAHSTGGASGQAATARCRTRRRWPTRCSRPAATSRGCCFERYGNGATTWRATTLSVDLNQIVGPTGALRAREVRPLAVASSLLSKFGIGEPPLADAPDNELRTLRRHSPTARTGPLASFLGRGLCGNAGKATAPMAPRTAARPSATPEIPGDPPRPRLTTRCASRRRGSFTPTKVWARRRQSRGWRHDDASLQPVHGGACWRALANAADRGGKKCRVDGGAPRNSILHTVAGDRDVQSVATALDVAARARRWPTRRTNGRRLFRRRRGAAAGVASPVGGDDDRQAVWDDMLQDLAEREAAEARTDVDEQWSAYLRRYRSRERSTP